MAHLREAKFLVVHFDLAVAEDHVARVVFAFIAIDGHQTKLAAARETFRDGCEGDGQIRVAVEHEKLFAEHRQGTLQRSARAEQHRAVVRVIKMHAMRAAIAEVALHHLAKVAEAEHGARDALAPQQRELMGEKWLARDRHEHLGDFFRDGPEPRGETAGENGNGHVG